MIEERECTKCHEVKPLSEFNIEKRRDGFTGRKNTKKNYVGIPESHHPSAFCKDCKDRQGRWGSYRYTARKRGYSWSLTREEFDALLVGDCFYCEASAKGSKLGVNGIDRKDNSVGYEPDNVVSCCGDCNKAKLTMSHRDFIIKTAQRAFWTTGAAPEIELM